MEIIALFDDFTVQRISRDENTVANDLAQQASSFWSNRGKFNFLEKTDVLVCQIRQSDFRLMCSVIVCSIRPSQPKPNDLVSEIRGSRISRTSDEASEMMTVDSDDWRTPLVHYLENHSHIADREVRR
jgi:hypothetical protein